nr:hypothetical protein [Tanacetum cinerariifolium]
MDGHVHDEIDGVMYHTNSDASISGKEVVAEVVEDKGRPMTRRRDMDEAAIEDEGGKLSRVYMRIVTG